MNNYDIFSKFYDSVMGDRATEGIMIEKMVKQYNPLTKSILELGCGTGIFLKYFFDHGYNVAGIDLSEKMLSLASQRVPGANLSQQDMTKFSLPFKYDAILCLFDSINHVLVYDDWEQMFSRVRAHLNEGGIFIFDINTKKKLEILSQSGPINSEFDGNKMIMNITPKEDVYIWNIKIIEKQEGGKDIVYEENIKEQTFPIKKIEMSLKSIFSKVVLLDQREGVQASEDSKRIYFICF
jgi:SAM-dependent methyltransferase